MYALHCFLRSGAKRRPKECSFTNGTLDLLKADRELDRSEMIYYDVREPAKLKRVTLCSQAKDEFDGLYLHSVQRGASKGHGIIRINLNPVCCQFVDEHCV